MSLEANCAAQFVCTDISLTANGRKKPEMLTDLLCLALVSAVHFFPKSRSSSIPHQQEENKNCIPIGLKSSPNEIKHTLGISKSYVLCTSQVHSALRQFCCEARRQFRTALQPLIRDRRAIVTDTSVTLLATRSKPGLSAAEQLSPAAAAAVARQREAERHRTTHRIIEAEEKYGLREPAGESSAMLPPSARHALIQAPVGGGSGVAGGGVSQHSTAAEVVSALRRGVPSAQPGKRVIEQQRKQHKHMRSSAYTMDPSQRFVFEAGELVAEEGGGAHTDRPPPGAAHAVHDLATFDAPPADLKMGELALRSRATAPSLPPGKVFAGGKYTLTPAQSWRLSKLEHKYDFEVLDTVIDKADLPAYLGQAPSAGGAGGAAAPTTHAAAPKAEEQQANTAQEERFMEVLDTSDSAAASGTGRSIPETVRDMETGASREGGVGGVGTPVGGGRKRALRAPRQRLAGDAARLKEHFEVQLGDPRLEKRGGGARQSRGPAPRGSVPGVSGEDSDLEFFMAELGEEGMGGYGDVFSDGEEGVTEALTYPTRVHLNRALARGEVDVQALSASSRSALERQLRSSRLPEHRAVLAGIRAMRAQLEASDAAAAGGNHSDEAEHRSK